MNRAQKETEGKSNESQQNLADDDIMSCSSSILNSPQPEEEEELMMDFDDDPNLTLLSSPQAPVKVPSREANTKKSLPEKKFIRLNGAGKKRFKYFLANGHSAQEARELAIAPMDLKAREQGNSDQNKRRRNTELDRSNSSDTNPLPKRMAYQSASRKPSRFSAQSRLDQIRAGPSGIGQHSYNPTYRDAVSATKVGIIPKDFPKIELTTRQILATQKAILKLVAQQRKQKIKPKFGTCLIRQGYMILICKNQDTVQWLKAIIPNIKPWEDANLDAVDEKNIPQPDILIGFFPYSTEDSTNEILALVESQNNGLDVDAWRIMKRQTIKEQHIQLNFTVDSLSMEALERCGFVLDYKFGTAPLRKRNSNEATEGKEPKSTGAICGSGNANKDVASGSRLKQNHIVKAYDIKVCESQNIICDANNDAVVDDTGASQGMEAVDANIDSAQATGSSTCLSQGSNNCNKPMCGTSGRGHHNMPQNNPTD